MTQKSQPWSWKNFQEEKHGQECLQRQQRFRGVTDAVWMFLQDRKSESCAKFDLTESCEVQIPMLLHVHFYSGSQCSIFSTEVMWYNVYFRKITLAAEWTIGFGTVRKWCWKKMKVIAMVKPRKMVSYYGLSCVSPKFLCWSSNRTPARTSECDYTWRQHL